VVFVSLMGLLVDASSLTPMPLDAPSWLALNASLADVSIGRALVLASMSSLLAPRSRTPWQADFHVHGG
jgi:hypothetical protein